MEKSNRNIGAWLRSFFQKKPVITGQGFTTTDTPSTASDNKSSYDALANYRLNDKLTFILVGQYRDNGKLSYRLYEVSERRTITLSEDLFKLLFKTH